MMPSSCITEKRQEEIWIVGWLLASVEVDLIFKAIQFLLTRLFQICQPILADQGFVLVNNLPPDFNYQYFLSQFGDLMPQYDQQLVWDVQVNPEIAHAKCSLGSVEVAPHTEYYEGESEPPKYLALWCIHPAFCGGGKIAFVDGYRFLETLSIDERNYLYQARYLYRSEMGLKQLNLGLEKHHCILSKSPYGKDIFRFNTTGMDEGDSTFLENFRQKFLVFYNENYYELYQPKNSLLLWDNYRMVHARSSGFKDKNRHLVRLWIKEKNS